METVIAHKETAKAASVSGVTVVCEWCRREMGAGTPEPPAILGVCESHVRGLFSRVDDLLHSLAALRASKNPAA